MILWADLYMYSNENIICWYLYPIYIFISVECSPVDWKGRVQSMVRDQPKSIKLKLIVTKLGTKRLWDGVGGKEPSAPHLSCGSFRCVANPGFPQDEVGTVWRGVLVKLTTVSISQDSTADASSDTCIVKQWLNAGLCLLPCWNFVFFLHAIE